MNWNLSMFYRRREFLKEHSVSCKPHGLSDYHAMDMFHMPTNGGCVFTGPSGPPTKKRVAKLRVFQPVLENFLKLPRPKDELLLQIELTPDEDGMAVLPGHLCFVLKSQAWRRKLPGIRSVAADLGLSVWQDADVQNSHILSFDAPSEASQATTAVMGLLSRACDFGQDAEITYSAGALDEI